MLVAVFVVECVWWAYSVRFRIMFLLTNVCLCVCVCVFMYTYVCMHVKEECTYIYICAHFQGGGGGVYFTNQKLLKKALQYVCT